LLTAGADAAIRLIVDALVATCGRLLLQIPNYVAWESCAALRGINVLPIEFGSCKPNAFTLQQFEAVLINSPPSVVALSNPNGPTGFGFQLSEIAALVELCKREGHLLVI